MHTRLTYVVGGRKETHTCLVSQRTAGTGSRLTGQQARRLQAGGQSERAKFGWLAGLAPGLLPT